MNTTLNHASENQPILIGNTFPLSLIRRRVKIAPLDEIENLRHLITHRPVVSFWGHLSTLPHVNRLLGSDLTPKTNRPAVQLTPEGLPALEGIVFNDCWVISPDYQPGYRPQIGEEVTPEKITGWQILHIEWL